MTGVSGAVATTALRQGLLEGTAVLLGAAAATGASADAPAGALEQACAGLGARVLRCEALSQGPPVEAVEEEQLAGALDVALAQAGGSIDAGLIDAAGMFSAVIAAGAPARSALMLALEGSWNLTRALAGRAFIGAAAPGRVVLIAPAPDAGEHAGAAVAGLENLSRTLSTEWARHSVTAVAVAPGAHTSAEELATVACYLLSGAGAYFSGCLLDLRGPGGA
jgi:NAD(P)-dependent dehydrogenase (short-subunit alcohol dehydrogenase family)